jgi:hypothetical protein
MKLKPDQIRAIQASDRGDLTATERKALASMQRGDFNDVAELLSEITLPLHAEVRQLLAKYLNAGLNPGATESRLEFVRGKRASRRTGPRLAGKRKPIDLDSEPLSGWTDTFVHVESDRRAMRKGERAGGVVEAMHRVAAASNSTFETVRARYYAFIAWREWDRRAVTVDKL